MHRTVPVLGGIAPPTGKGVERFISARGGRLEAL